MWAVARAILMTAPTAPRISRGLSQFVSSCSLLAMAFGLWVLLGWTFHSYIVKSILPGQVTVKANTAGCFILIGFALWILRREDSRAAAGWKLAAKMAALITSVVGLLSLLEFLFGWDLGIDQLWFHAGAEDIPGSVRPGLMSPITALGFLGLGSTLLLLDVRSRLARWSAQLLPCGVAIGTMFCILDFVLDPTRTRTYISPLTALLLFFLSFALLFARTGWGIGRLTASPTLGGTLTRRIFPAAVVIPLMFGWLRWRGEPAGMFSAWTGLTVMTVFTVVLLGSLTVWTGFTVDRSERERRRLEESETQLASIVRSSNDAIFSKTLDGIVTSWNPGAEAIYGYSAEEMIGQSISRTIPTDQCQDFAAILERVKQGQRVEHYETTRLHKDGRTIQLSLSISPIRDEAGLITGASTVARDISERKRAERALRALSDCNESLMRATDEPSLLQRICDLVVKVGGYRLAWVGYAEHDERKTVRVGAESGDETGYLTTVNITWADEERGHGPTGTAIRTGKATVCHDVISDPRFAPWREQALKRGYRSTLVLPLKNGEQVLGAISIYAAEAGAFDAAEQDLLEELSGNLGYGIAALRAEAERKRAELALQESEVKFRTLSELVPQMVWACTPDGLNVYFNQRWVEYTGLTLEESYGRGWNTPFHDDDKQTAWDAWNGAVATGDPYQVESRLRAADGSYRWFLMRGVPLRDASGSIVKWFGTGTDIDEMKRAGEETRKLNQILEERVQQRTAQLGDSEQRVRRKLDSILSPQGNLAGLDLADLIDIPAVQSLADDIYKLAQIPMFILDRQSRVLVSVGWQEICTKFHRVHPEACKNCEESDRELSTGVAPGEFKLYKCKNHLWDVVTPIMLGREQVGNLFSGQFFFSDETVDLPLFRAQAKQYGFDEREYLAALERVPRLSRAEVETGMKFYTKLAQLLSQLSYSGIQVARSMTETGRANAELAASVKELEAFTYSVSHDLRAPLRHISGFSRILTEEYGPNLPSDAQHHLQRIQDGTRRMGLLVDDLLNLARVGRRDLSLRVSGLKSLVDEVICGAGTGMHRPPD